MTININAAGLVIHPGDTLVIALAPDRRLTNKEFDEIRTSVEQQMPEVNVLLLGGARQIAAYRPGSGDPDLFATTDLT